MSTSRSRRRLLEVDTLCSKLKHIFENIITHHWLPNGAVDGLVCKAKCHTWPFHSHGISFLLCNFCAAMSTASSRPRKLYGEMLPCSKLWLVHALLNAHDSTSYDSLCLICFMLFVHNVYAAFHVVHSNAWAFLLRLNFSGGCMSTASSRHHNIHANMQNG